MKNNQLAKKLSGIIFLFSLFLLVFSIYNIYAANNITDEALKEWEQRKGEEGQEQKKQIEKEEIEISVVDNESFDVVSEEPEQAEVKKKLYSSRPKKGDVFGKILIPSINKDLPIVEGTDATELAKGVGHFIGSVLPGESDNTVLAGHRDTVFRGLGDVKIGDLVEIETSAGTFIYKVSKQRIVDSDDRTVIVPNDDPILTLVTCYPFNYVGNAPQRYILVADLIEIK